MRHNLDGTGYRSSLRSSSVSKGCPSGGCTGYELMTDLDFSDVGDLGYNSCLGSCGTNVEAFPGCWLGTHRKCRWYWS